VCPSFSRLLLLVLLVACDSVAPDGEAGKAGECPAYMPMDIHLRTPQIRGSCSQKGQTCTTNTGLNLCRGFGEGTGFVEGECTCDGETWVCLPHNLSKNNGCPLTPCSLLKPQAGPQTSRTGLLYCTPKDHASCEVNLWELCPGGSKGQTVRWTCGCEQDGSFTCTPEPQQDASCP